jgi:hypothetical protein
MNLAKVVESLSFTPDLGFNLQYKMISFCYSMLNDFSAGNLMVSAMIAVSKAAGIASSSPTGTSVNDVLICWGKAIHKDFEANTTKWWLLLKICQKTK